MEYTGIVCCLIECFHGNIVLLIIFHYNHTIYPKCEYFIITVVSIILNLTKQYFPVWNSLFNKHQDFYRRPEAVVRQATINLDSQIWKSLGDSLPELYCVDLV
jgi:hypothetical protein